MIFLSIPNHNGDVTEVLDFVLTLKCNGGTDINSALLEALRVANTDHDKSTPKMIVMLTDGRAQSGETSSPKIKQNIKRANTGKVSIYGLAFGEDADFDLIKGISDENLGFALKISQGKNSFEQIEAFYNQISGKVNQFETLMK